MSGAEEGIRQLLLSSWLSNTREDVVNEGSVLTAETQRGIEALGHWGIAWSVLRSWKFLSSEQVLLTLQRSATLLVRTSTCHSLERSPEAKSKIWIPFVAPSKTPHQTSNVLCNSFTFPVTPCQLYILISYLIP